MMKTIGPGPVHDCGVVGDASMAGGVNRDKLLKEPGVYGTFAAFLIDGEWGKLRHNGLDWYGVRR